ncbi:unnamed protein product [Rotaria sordida]|uniref:Relish n=1 Tax=Rotaria sordida TaxID=392033 RepID=A0A813WE93_9BILA|nr:unnamed protein product [Rotaria sordida]
MSTPLYDQMNDETNNFDVPQLSAEFLEISNDLDLLSVLSGSNNGASSDFSPELNLNSCNEDQVDEITAFLSGIPPRSNSLEIIAQPCYTSKLRTLQDNLKEKRRHTLKAKNKNSPFTGPTIRIPKCYFNVDEQYYIGIFLVTVFHEKSNCRYIHPYGLKDVDHEDRNDQRNNAVWFPIGDEDSDDIKSFPGLHIDKKTGQAVKNYGILHPFDGEYRNSLNNFVPELTSGTKIVHEYNLKKTQLAFTIGRKINIDDRFPTILDSHLTIYSDEMMEDTEKETVEDTKSTESVAQSNSPPPDCRMYKYAPRSGYTTGNEEVLIFYTNKLEKKYGNLLVTFEYDTPNINEQTSFPAIDIEVKGQMVSFKTPIFPYSINEPTPVKIILQQKDRMLETLRYFYVPKSQCSTCQANMMKNPEPFIRNTSNKRTKSSLCQLDDVNDAVVPICESKTELRQAKSELSSINTNQTDYNQQLLDKLSGYIATLFTDNDYKPILRFCRPFIQKRPELLHIAIKNNHSDLLSKFIPIAKINILQQKNEFGETVLLHATRLNCIDIVKALLEKEDSDKLLEDINSRGQNVFHILAMNINSEEIFDLLIEHLIKNSINISEKFDHVDDDNHTPLQLAIISNNLSVTRHFLKHFNKTVCKTNDYTGDNLIHLAVRYSNLTMLKLLLDDEKLIVQGVQSNLTRTPLELARLMKHNDMVEYFNEIYSQPEVDENDSSEDD